MTNIYAILNANNEPIYIGKTVGTINKRFKRHLREKNNTKITKWLRRNGANAKIELIETVNNSEWENAEIFWIAYFKMLGANLLNMTNGGESAALGNKLALGIVRTKTTREKISKAQKNKTVSVATRELQSLQRKNKPWSEKQRLSYLTTIQDKEQAIKTIGKKWSEGKTLKELCKEYNMSPAFVRKQLKSLCLYDECRQSFLHCFPTIKENYDKKYKNQKKMPRRKISIHVCTKCGKEFEDWSCYDKRKRKNKYCSKTCYFSRKK